MSANSDKLMAAIAESLEKMPNLVYMGKSVETLMNICKPMVGATASSNGKGGFVPTPTKSNRSQFLRGDGTWHDVVTKEDADTVKVKSENGTDFTGYLLSDTSNANITLNTAKKHVDAKLQHFINTDKISHVALSLGSESSNGYLEIINTSKFSSRIMTENRHYNTTYLLPNTNAIITKLVATDTLPDLLVNSATKGMNITGTNGYGQLKLSYGDSWDIIFRHDGSNFYILKSDTHGGTYTTARPLTITNAGVCNINGNAVTATTATNATNATNAQNANTVGGIVDAYHMGTYNMYGNGHNAEHLLYVQHNVKNDDRFMIIDAGGPDGHGGISRKEVRVDYATSATNAATATSATNAANATNAKNADNATYATYKKDTTNTLVANKDSSAIIGDVTIASDGIKKNNVSKIPLNEWYYRPVIIQSSQPSSAVGALWIKV